MRQSLIAAAVLVPGFSSSLIGQRAANQYSAVGPGDTMNLVQTLETRRGARPTPVPDSFRVLVYAPAK